MPHVHNLREERFSDATTEVGTLCVYLTTSDVERHHSTPT